MQSTSIVHGFIVLCQNGIETMFCPGRTEFTSGLKNYLSKTW